MRREHEEMRRLSVAEKSAFLTGATLICLHKQPVEKAITPARTDELKGQTAWQARASMCYRTAAGGGNIGGET